MPVKIKPRRENRRKFNITDILDDIITRGPDTSVTAELALALYPQDMNTRHSVIVRVSVYVWEGERSGVWHGTLSGLKWHGRQSSSASPESLYARARARPHTHTQFDQKRSIQSQRPRLVFATVQQLWFFFLTRNYQELHVHKKGGEKPVTFVRVLSGQALAWP